MLETVFCRANSSKNANIYVEDSLLIGWHIRYQWKRLGIHEPAAGHLVRATRNHHYYRNRRIQPDRTLQGCRLRDHERQKGLLRAVRMQ